MHDDDHMSRSPFVTRTVNHSIGQHPSDGVGQRRRFEFFGDAGHVAKDGDARHPERHDDRA